ncbi:MAG: DUF4176 domain-containing protein [Bacilli bacterium]|nr:DUF4176 domain-containing protein [Bacilli bacterium]
MNTKLLPIGSVVLLEGGEKKLMVTGFYTISDESPDEVYDYCGCLYPEGVISSDEVYVFNKDQIAEVSFIGYEDEEGKEFQENLLNAVKEVNNTVENKDNDEEKTTENEIERL